MKDLIIFGTSSFAEIADEYFTHDSIYCVEAFTVEKNFRDGKTSFRNKYLIDFENVEEDYPPSEFDLFIAVGYGEYNKIRLRIFNEAKKKGYNIATYISSRSFVWHNVQIGEGCFIFEDNTIQPFVNIGDSNIFWSGNHIGHHSKIGNNNFFTSHVVISGYVNVGNDCFFGVNSTVVNNITIPDNTYLKATGIATKDYIYEMGKKRTYILPE
jgi:sugar O-acyltransferase (sialic acid O-acetyltransferase NeuD family)